MKTVILTDGWAGVCGDSPGIPPPKRLFPMLNIDMNGLFEPGPGEFPGIQFKLRIFKKYSTCACKIRKKPSNPTSR